MDFFFDSLQRAQDRADAVSRLVFLLENQKRQRQYQEDNDRAVAIASAALATI
ncbi:hypothetical protein [Methylogaea oryzae]|uniref:hypothetical protein n=1 Tax=Methylogaea oryzae TaxID=1295382 RepID=UPI0012E32C96|nr:hypothetical protein [Methylogaea oryzae]